MDDSYFNRSQAMSSMADTSMMNKSWELEYPPLSQQPVVSAPLDISIDSLELSRSTPKSDPREVIEKDTFGVMTDTNFLIKFGLDQSKHQKAVNHELKTLLEHEKKILTQLMERANKFTAMKEENKEKIDAWEAEHRQKIPPYYQYLKQLIDIPESECISQEGVPGEVQQRILYQIVDNTSNIADNAIVQLSLQNTLVNDVDLSLTQLKQFCTVMMRYIDNWLRMLNTQDANQNRVLDQWNTLTAAAKKLKEQKPEVDESSTDFQNLMTSLDSRLSKLETNVKSLQEGMCPPQAPPNSPEQPKDSKRFASSRMQRSPQYPPGFPSDQLYCDLRPAQVEERPARPASPPQVFPTGDEYFGFPRTPPQQPVQYTPVTPAQEPTYVEGRLQRSRATPGQFPVDVIDIPGMGFPIPRAALEKGGRPRGTPIVKTPPPQQYGRFNPMAASSPKGFMRSPAAYTQPPQPQVGEAIDSALLPKIKEDLQRLSRRNKKLEELVNNFKNMRRLLTEEMDKAVRLNQKLQRDLYYIAQEANKQS